MIANVERLKTAASLVRDGRSLPVGDVLLSSEDANTLSITGWTHFSSLASLSQQSALAELDEVKCIFRNMLEVCPDLLYLTGKKRVKFCLGLDYGMGAVRVCSEVDKQLVWEIELES